MKIFSVAQNRGLNFDVLTRGGNWKRCFREKKSDISLFEEWKISENSFLKMLVKTKNNENAKSQRAVKTAKSDISAKSRKVKYHFSFSFFTCLIRSFTSNKNCGLYFNFKGRRFAWQVLFKYSILSSFGLFFSSILFHALATTVSDGIFWLESENFSKIILNKNSMIHC